MNNNSAFIKSTHYKYWIFKEEEIESIHSIDHNKALTRIQRKKNANPPLSLDEEISLILHFNIKLQEICRSLHFPPNAEATASMMYRRYFLKNCVMEQNPEIIMSACILLTAKIEEHVINRQKFANMIGRDLKMLVKMELNLLETLNFNMHMYHPYRPIRGFIEQLSKYWTDCGGATMLNLKDMQIQAALYVPHIYLTNIILVYTPSQIALATIMMVIKDHSKQHPSIFTLFLSCLDNMLTQKDGDVDHIKQLKVKLLRIEKVCRNIIKKQKQLVEDELRRISRKRKSCRNSLQDPTSKVYKKAEEKHLQQLQEKRMKRVRQKQEEEMNRMNSILGNDDGDDNLMNVDDDDDFIIKRI